MQTEDLEWDDEKAAENLKKHGVTFEEASTVLRDPFSLTLYDTPHSADEDRSITLGYSERLRILMVVHVERSERLRIISARRANRAEQVLFLKPR